MITIMAIVSFVGGIFFAFIGWPMAAAGCWVFTFICGTSSIESQIRKQSRALTGQNEIIIEELGKLVALKRAETRKNGVKLDEKESHKVDGHWTARYGPY